uniref:Hemolysin-type calcium-binding repeat-containing protein n=1 Tax=Candidatus Kentrum sp. DK TaxID=2126562 RepID=A0A450T1Q7_9GAMM|nr:MAG: Hemolysin-type calcium-binding repeat-containing protein [Candidatus Kentron sp. DK]
MYGGTGNDIFTVNQANDTVKEYTNQGVDEVRSYVSYTLPDNVENLTLIDEWGFDPDSSATGNELANTLIGNNGDNTLTGLSGDDDITGNDGDDILNGGAGNDVIWGNDGSDRISGGTGNDFLWGGAKADVLSGGSGTDTFYFYQPSDGHDSITDFQSGIDKIWVKSANFENLSLGLLTADRFISGSNPTPTNGNAGFLYNTSTGVLTFDSNGNSGIDSWGQTAIATLVTRPSNFSYSDIQIVA